MLLLKIDDILLRIDEIQDTISSRPAPLHFPSSVLRFRNYSSFWMEEKLDVDRSLKFPPALTVDG